MELWDSASPTAFQTGLMTVWISNMPPDDSTLSFFCAEKGLSALCDGLFFPLRKANLTFYFTVFPSQQQKIFPQDSTLSPR